MKKIFCIVLTLAMLCCLFAGCGSQPAADPGPANNSNAADPAPANNSNASDPAPADSTGDKPSIGFVMLGMGNEFFEGIVNAYLEAFTAAGWDADYVSGDFDATKTIEGIENYTAMGKDVIICFPIAGPVVDNAVKEARAAGCKVIMMVEETSEWDGYLSSDNVATGKANAWMMAQWIEEKYPDAAPGSIDIAMLQTFDSLTDTAQTEGLEAITDYTDKVNVKVRYELAGQNTSDGLQAAENIYTTNPEIKLFLTTSNAIALGVNSFYTAINSPADDLSEYGAWGTNISGEAIQGLFDSMENKCILRGVNVQAGIAETIRCFMYLAEGLLDGSIEKEEIPAAVYLVSADNVAEYTEKGETALQWDYENEVGHIVG